MRGWLAPGVLTAAALSACSVTPGEPLGQSALAIVGGDGSDASQNAVVLLERDDASGVPGAGICSGTLIAPNLVLTARHCLSETTGEDFACSVSGVGTISGAIGPDFDPPTIRVYSGARHSTADPPSAIGAKVLHDGAANLCDHDVALLLLDRKVAGVPIAPVRVDARPIAGDTFTAVGWGATESAPYPLSRYQRTNVKVDEVGPLAVADRGIVLPANEFHVGESICSGDSGGPAFDSISGAVIGVASRGGNGGPFDRDNPSSSCIGAGNVYTQTAGMKDTIQRALAAAGEGASSESSASTTGGCSVAAPARSHGYPVALLVLALLGAGTGARRHQRVAARTRPGAP